MARMGHECGYDDGRRCAGAAMLFCLFFFQCPFQTDGGADSHHHPLSPLTCENSGDEISVVVLELPS